MSSRSIRVSEGCYQTLVRLSEDQKRTITAVAELAVDLLASSRLSDVIGPRMTLDPLHGIPEAVGTMEEFPRTWRSPEDGGYLGISREGVPSPEKSADREPGKHPVVTSRGPMQTRQAVLEQLKSATGLKTAAEVASDSPTKRDPVVEYGGEHDQRRRRGF